MNPEMLKSDSHSPMTNNCPSHHFSLILSTDQHLSCVLAYFVKSRTTNFSYTFAKVNSFGFDCQKYHFIFPHLLERCIFFLEVLELRYLFYKDFYFFKDPQTLIHNSYIQNLAYKEGQTFYN